ncbi:class I SAM-dependent methyltransferase [Chloroflexota bacterium]
MRSYRRILLDRDLEESKCYMKGTILDIGGGRKRGNFKEPSDAEWIVLDSDIELCPDILSDAQNIPMDSNTVDCVKCTELLEHVEYPERVLDEISRILRPGGTLILSTPFSVGIHSDPHDFQRFTDEKLSVMLAKNFQIVTLKRQGLYFTVLASMIKQGILNSKRCIKRPFRILFPMLDLLVRLDNLESVKNSKFMSSFTTGFFVVATQK